MRHYPQGGNRIIGVLNKSYGSPNADSSNIPFDIRHIRYPIEYEYSAKSDKKKTKQKLIGDLTGALRTTALYALQHQKDKYLPFVTWEDWNKQHSGTQVFHTNEKIVSIMESIKSSIQNQNGSFRLIGLSGLGKTRVLLETFRCGLDENSIILSSRVLYLNYNNYLQSDLSSILNLLVQHNQNHILKGIPPKK